MSYGITETDLQDRTYKPIPNSRVHHINEGWIGIHDPHGELIERLIESLNLIQFTPTEGMGEISIAVINLWIRPAGDDLCIQHSTVAFDATHLGILDMRRHEIDLWNDFIEERMRKANAYADDWVWKDRIILYWDGQKY